MKRITNSALLGLLFFASSAVRADQVVPTSLVGTDADGAFFLTTTLAAGRTYQMTIDSGQLTGLVGQTITGMQWRLNAAATANWPAVNVTYAFWDVFIGPGVDPSVMSNTFASNFTGVATQVRSGGYGFVANSMTFGASPNAFGPTLDLTTPFVYTGGDLAIEMRFAQQIGGNQPSIDAVNASGGPANGWGVDFAARWTGNSAGTTGANGNFIVTNFVVLAVPEPTTLALFGALGLVPVVVRRQLKKRRRRQK